MKEKFLEALQKESDYKLNEEVARNIAESVSQSIDFSNQYEVHKSIRQRALDILPKIKATYFVA
ncbi:hypothetical protein AB3K25_03515 [Leuconostoc sp. MS02]|uniref:Uncharacterized protein n=1 Tax=Leuconostoc aquikimchii TaxID=3236804 RepID=A0ABV3S3T6_9LACO